MPPAHRSLFKSGLDPGPDPEPGYAFFAAGAFVKEAEKEAPPPAGAMVKRQEGESKEGEAPPAAPAKKARATRQAPKSKVSRVSYPSICPLHPTLAPTHPTPGVPTA